MRPTGKPIYRSLRLELDRQCKDRQMFKFLQFFAKCLELVLFVVTLGFVISQ